MRKENLPPDSSISQIEKDLDEAIHRVYEEFGPDLSEFSRAVQRCIDLQGRESSERQMSKKPLR